MNVYVYVGVLAYILHDVCVYAYILHYVYVGVLAYILHECLCVCGCVGLYST